MEHCRWYSLKVRHLSVYLAPQTLAKCHGELGKKMVRMKLNVNHCFPQPS